MTEALLETGLPGVYSVTQQTDLFMLRSASLK